MKTLKEALFSKKNMNTSFYTKPFDFLKNIDKYYNSTGPFVAVLIPEPDCMYKVNRIVFVMKTNYDLEKTFNTIKSLKNIDLDTYTTIDRLKEIKRNKYFSLLFYKNSIKSDDIACMRLNPREGTMIKHFSFGDYEYINNPEDPKELEDIYKNFIVPELNS